MKSTRLVCLCACLASIPIELTHAAAIRYDQSTRVFELSGEHVTYAFGVNQRAELQSLYWGGRLAPEDALQAARFETRSASFDPSAGVTPQEYPAWGSALYTEPALKMSFPDGNRDLVLHYVSHALDGAHLSVRLKDISRDVWVELRYDIDPESGVLGRSARIENHTGKLLSVQQAAAATFTLPANKTIPGSH